MHLNRVRQFYLVKDKNLDEVMAHFQHRLHFIASALLSGGNEAQSVAN